MTTSLDKIPWVFHRKYDIPLPTNHRFTSTKFSDLYNKLSDSKYKNTAQIYFPKPATEHDLQIAHHPEYIHKVKFGYLNEKEVRKLGLSWTSELSERSFLAVNGTLLTAYLAIQKGIACHLAGGTHHAHFDFGSGFCVFNDLAYTALSLVKTGELQRVLIFDCDVHQGDGTARILQSNKNIFTCSIHAKKNFPYYKAESDLDVELSDNCSSNDYKHAVSFSLEQCLKSFDPELIIYVAGADIHKNDALGRLDVDDMGLIDRDLMVLKYFQERSIPVATVIGGGYSKDRQELSNRHASVFKAAHQLWN